MASRRSSRWTSSTVRRAYRVVQVKFYCETIVTQIPEPGLPASSTSRRLLDATWTGMFKTRTFGLKSDGTATSTPLRVTWALVTEPPAATPLTIRKVFRPGAEANVLTVFVGPAV